jgi:NADH-quinone oxidoreductase subunit J
MFFYLFALSIIIAALGVVMLKNPVHSVMCLIMVFLSSAGLFVLLGAEFLAMMLVVVYVGAVAVLFLFVVMMLDTKDQGNKNKQIISATFTIGLAAIGVIKLLLNKCANSNQMILLLPTNISNTEMIGAVLYSDFIVAFQVAGIVLLVAIVGAITLTTQARRPIKRQDLAKQLARDGSCVSLVNIENNSPVKGINYDL